jgi:hypothetical protein
VKIYIVIVEALRKKEKGDETSQSELVATNALIPRSIHWMGYVSSFGVKWGSS